MAHHPEDDVTPSQHRAEESLPEPNKSDLDSDSAIDFSELNEEEMSGISVIEWASLVEAQPGSPAASDPVEPSLEEVNDVVDLTKPVSAGVGKVEQRDSDSSIDLSSSAVIDVDAQQANVGDSASLSGPGEPIELKAIDLQDAALVEERYEDEEIDLADDALILGSSASMEQQADEFVELGDEDLIDESSEQPRVGQSDVNLGGIEEVATGHTGSSVSFEDQMLLDHTESGPGASGSLRDLIAENLESGVDLLKSKQSPMKEEPEEDDFLSEVSAGDESSSVDLGSMHSIPVFDVSEEEEAAKKAAGKKTPIPYLDEPIDLGEVLEDKETDLDLEQIEDSQPVPVRRAAAKTVADADEEIDLTEAAAQVAPVVGDEPKSKKSKQKLPSGDAPVKPRRPVFAAVGSGLAGLLAGAAAMFGAVQMDLIPGVSTGPAAKGPPPSAVQQPVAPTAKAATFEQTLEHIRSGNFDKVEPADLERVDENKHDQLVARAEFRWLNHLKSVRGADPRAALRGDVEEVRQALQDLEKALASPNPQDVADALALRGQIYELLGDLARARADYEAGAKLQGQQQRFNAALQLLDLSSKVGRWLPPGLDPRTVALLLTAFQPMPEGGEGQAATKPLPLEAGFAFWKALVAAKAGQYDEAIKQLDAARALHDQRRYLLPKKQQNPLSDPREEIFLKSCDLLKTHFQLQAGLSNPNYLTADPMTRPPQINALLARADEAARAAMLKDVAARLVKEKPPATLDDLVKHIESERKTVETQLANLQKQTTEQQKELTTLNESLKSLTADLRKTQETLKTTQADLTRSKSEAEATLTALRDVAKTAGSEFKDLKTSKKALLRDIGEAARLAKLNDPMGTLRQLERDLKSTQETLAQRWEPTKMLTYWIPLLEQARADSAILTPARRDAQLVFSDAKASESDRARAMLVQGLALRNEEKYVEAAALLEKAAPALAKANALEAKLATQALREVKNPVATLIQQVAELEAAGKRPDALALLNRGIDRLPEPKAELYVHRARMTLDLLLAKEKLDANDPLVTQLRQDAARDGSAESAYLVGQLEERLGRLDQAEKQYRAAVAAHNKNDEIGSRYRIALARVLLRRQSEPASTRPLPPATRLGMLPVHLTGLLMATTLQGAGSDAVSEAELLADQILALGDKVPFDVRAQALAVKGLHTRALQTYIGGLKEKGLLPPQQALTLSELMNNHPGLSRPDSKATPEPLQAEKHYAAGLNLFFARKYAEAEKEMLAAIENDSTDARYFYYLGLSRLAQGKRGAVEDFDQGARLEQQGRPDRTAVSQALERIQGRIRQTLNDIRERPAR